VRDKLKPSLFFSYSLVDDSHLLAELADNLPQRLLRANKIPSGKHRTALFQSYRRQNKIPGEQPGVRFYLSQEVAAIRSPVAVSANLGTQILLLSVFQTYATSPMEKWTIEV